MSLFNYIKDTRILIPIVIVLLLLLGDVLYGTHLGIEFVGGTQIPLALEHAVNQYDMGTLITALSQRTSAFGLKEVVIQGVGESEVLVTIPMASNADIQGTIGVIEKQGVFQGIVNGREALNGSAILGGGQGIQPAATQTGNNVTWQVSFYVTQPEAVKFSKVVFGQANKPLYMFLDRPIGAVLLLNQSLINKGGAFGETASEELSAMETAVQFGNQTIPIETATGNYSNWNTLYHFFSVNRNKYSDVILTYGTPNNIISNLASLNYTFTFSTLQNLTPQIVPVQNNLTTSFVVNVWPAIGLLSAPNLSPGVTNGNVNQGYTISGSAPVNYSLVAKENYAKNQSQTIASILSGGALPVQVIVGTPTVVPPTLGSHFEVISVIAIFLAILAVAITIVIRYKKLFLIVPIILTTVAELFIIGSVIGLIGTIDLSAVAGMIAVVGTGVDAQIIITDEVLSGSVDSSSFKIKLNHAFYIVWADAMLLMIAMLPLLFSTSLVTVIGFAESTILGALLGVIITRPAYAAMISRHYKKSEESG